MKDLVSQEIFELLWNHKTDETGATPYEYYEGCRPKDRSWIVYFTAAWCGPCKRLDTAILDEVAKSKELTIWKCDVVVNDYTSGYCGVKSFPTFMHFQPKKVVSTFQSNNTDEVSEWLLKQ